MNEPVRFLTSFAQSVATMALYGPSHPARMRAVDASYGILRELQTHDSRPEFSFLGDEVVYGQHPLRDMRDWEWGARLAAAGVQRLEFAPDVSREDFEIFLEGIVTRLALPMLDGAQLRLAGARGTGAIRFGALGIRGESRLTAFVPEVALPATPKARTSRALIPMASASAMVSTETLSECVVVYSSNSRSERRGRSISWSPCIATASDRTTDSASSRGSSARATTCSCIHSTVATSSVSS